MRRSRPSHPEVQPPFAIKLIDPLMIDHPHIPTQQDVDPEIAVAHACLRQIADAQPQGRPVDSAVVVKTALAT